MDPGDVPEVRMARLVLRGPTREDLAAWAAFIDASPEFLRYVPRSKAPRTALERAERFTAGYLARWDQDPAGIGWAVVDHEGRLVGMAGVDATATSEGELEYFVGMPYWRQGYATEMARARTVPTGKNSWVSTRPGQFHFS